MNTMTIARRLRILRHRAARGFQPPVRVALDGADRADVGDTMSEPPSLPRDPSARLSDTLD